MAKKKFTPRIVILIATEEFRWELSRVAYCTTASLRRGTEANTCVVVPEKP